jgi:hypothetical protein
MKQRILAGMGIAAVMALLVGCGEITFSGLFNIHEQISFAQEGKNDQNGNWQSFRAPVTVVLPAGQFNAKATIGQSGNQKQIKLEVSNTNPATVVELNFDKNINIADSFTLTAAQIKQNFDLSGNIVTKIERGPEQSGNEYCTTQQPQTVCRGLADTSKETAAIESVTTEISKLGGFPGAPGFNGPTPPMPHPPVCNTIWVTRPGNMYVRFYYETTLRDITASFMQGVKNLGDFQGHASSTEKVITYQGQCY